MDEPKKLRIRMDLEDGGMRSIESILEGVGLIIPKDAGGEEVKKRVQRALVRLGRLESKRNEKPGKEELQELYLKHGTVRGVAKQLQRSHVTVWYWLKDAGVELQEHSSGWRKRKLTLQKARS